MKIFLMVVSSIIMAANTSSAQTSDETAVKKILNQQISAWNEGQLEKFMQGYWQNDSLKFIGKSGITYGWEQALENYKKTYPDTTAMGKLAFDFIEIKPLSAKYIFVVGKWRLTRSIGNVSGHYTLLFSKIKGKWVIIADHSS